jgi:hypothetical protein
MLSIADIEGQLQAMTDHVPSSCGNGGIFAIRTKSANATTKQLPSHG